MTPYRSAVAAGAVCALAIASAAAPQASPAATWYAIMAEDGPRIGHASEEITVRPDGRDIVESREIYLVAQGEPGEQAGAPTRISERTVTHEDADGKVVSITSEERTGGRWVRYTAHIGAAQADIVRETRSDRRAAVVALSPGVRFDAGNALLPAWDRSQRLELDNLDVDGMSVEHIVIEAAPGAHDPRGVTALRRRYDGDQLRSVSRLVLDGDGRIVEAVQPMFGVTIRTVATDRATALRPHPPYRVLPAMMTRSPFRILPAAARGHIRYQLTFRDGIAFTLPETGEQRVTDGDGAVTLDICGDCGPGLPSDADTLAHALEPTAWLQSDHRRLRAIAAPVARRRVSDARKMELLIDRARPALERLDFVGHYSALETLSRRAGDCTEAAVLLAALGRAAGIPTRVASGLVYSRESYHGVSNVFMPHSWTLAFVDGQWRSFDLALDDFDATHIALTIGDGDDRSIASAGQLASLLVWEGMAEIRTPPDAN